MVPSQLKLGIIIATTELCPAIPLLVTFDLYLGQRISIVQNRQFQCLRNRACHHDEIWFGFQVQQSTVCDVNQFCSANLHSGGDN